MKNIKTKRLAEGALIAVLAIGMGTSAVVLRSSNLKMEVLSEEINSKNQTISELVQSNSTYKSKLEELDSSNKALAKELTKANKKIDSMCRDVGYNPQDITESS